MPSGPAISAAAWTATRRSAASSTCASATSASRPRTPRTSPAPRPGSSCCSGPGGASAATRERFRPPRAMSFAQVLVEEAGNLAENLPGLGRGVVADVMGVALAFEHLQHGLDAGLAQLAVDAHGVAEQEVARAGVRIVGGKPA